MNSVFSFIWVSCILYSYMKSCMHILKKSSSESVWGKNKREDMGTWGYVQQTIYTCIKF